MSASPLELWNDHNVYILGAGFSRDAGLPLISDFLVRMRDSHEWLTNHQRRREAEAVAKVLQFRLDASSAAYWVNLDIENIEELFSLASASKGDMDKHIRIAIAATIDFARQDKAVERRPLIFQGDSVLFGRDGATVRSVPKLPRWVEFESGVGRVTIHPYTFHVARLLGMLRDGVPKGKNTFITFNYDTVLEEALDDLGLPFTYGFMNFSADAPGEVEKNGIPVLKLHGSTTWSREVKEGSPLTIHRTSKEPLRASFVPELIPPTWKKVFQHQLQEVWEFAIQQISTATRLIIIGFSIPPTDMHFKYLMAAGLQQNVSLRQVLFVNPTKKEDLEFRVRKLLRESYIESKQIDFEVATLLEFTRASALSKFHTIGRPGETSVPVSI